VDYFTQQTRNKLLQLPTAEYQQGYIQAEDTQNRILSALTSDMRDIEIMAGWCRYKAYRSITDANLIIDITSRNRLIGAAQAYEECAEELERKVGAIKNSLAMVTGL
jgi:hypothetical protein